MDISPQRVRTAEFKTVKRGLDPDEVRSFLSDVADELERAQNQSTAMEARARAAVARLQELTEGAAAPAASPTAETPASGLATSETPAVVADDRDDVREQRPVAAVTASVDEAETISRTLLLAQRTADTTIAEAQAEADRISREAGDEASKTLDSTREMSSKLLEEAREEARKVGEEERVNMQAAVNSLMARRDFLESDVDHLERHLADERSRLREAATTLLDLTEKVPGGLGEVRRPLMSAGDDDATIEPVADDDDGDGVDDGGSDGVTGLSDSLDFTSQSDVASERHPLLGD